MTGCCFLRKMPPLPFVSPHPGSQDRRHVPDQPPWIRFAFPRCELAVGDAFTLEDCARSSRLAACHPALVRRKIVGDPDMLLVGRVVRADAGGGKGAFVGRCRCWPEFDQVGFDDAHLGLKGRVTRNA
jgi:hypothetical protein